ncbi:MAG: hypothetical protein LBI39_02550 [Puniceicoccales bacterium]|nr:hypothetical protein [Puniceicoccales bacterium]
MMLRVTTETILEIARRGAFGATAESLAKICISTAKKILLWVFAIVLIAIPIAVTFIAVKVSASKPDSVDARLSSELKGKLNSREGCLGIVANEALSLVELMVDGVNDDVRSEFIGAVRDREKFPTLNVSLRSSAPADGAAGLCKVISDSLPSHPPLKPKSGNFDAAASRMGDLFAAASILHKTSQNSQWDLTAEMRGIRAAAEAISNFHFALYANSNQCIYGDIVAAYDTHHLVELFKDKGFGTKSLADVFRIRTFDSSGFPILRDIAFREFIPAILDANACSTITQLSHMAINDLKAVVAIPKASSDTDLTDLICCRLAVDHKDINHAEHTGDVGGTSELECPSAKIPTIGSVGLDVSVVNEIVDELNKFRQTVVGALLNESAFAGHQDALNAFRTAKQNAAGQVQPTTDIIPEEDAIRNAKKFLLSIKGRKA